MYLHSEITALYTSSKASGGVRYSCAGFQIAFTRVGIHRKRCMCVIQYYCFISLISALLFTIHSRRMYKPRKLSFFKSVFNRKVCTLWTSQQVEDQSKDNLQSADWNQIVVAYGMMEEDQFLSLFGCTVNAICFSEFLASSCSYGYHGYHQVPQDWNLGDYNFKDHSM